MKVSIVIPNWNGRVLLEKNLPSVILASKHEENEIGEIIIVDDKSKDNSVSFLKQNFSEEIKLVCHTKNRGFSAAVNTGVRTARYPLVCLINTDVIPEKNFLVSVQKIFKDENVFGVSLHEKGYGFTKGAFESGFIVHKPVAEKKIVSPAFWVSGGSSVIRRKYWIELQGFDEKILSPFYWEDVDLSYRALKRGYKLYWDPNAKVVHKHESVINKDNFMLWKLNLVKERNYLLFNWKNITSHNFFKKHIIGVLNRLRKHPGYIKVVLYALFKIKAVRAARRKEFREVVLSDEAIFAKFNE